MQASSQEMANSTSPSKSKEDLVSSVYITCHSAHSTPSLHPSQTQTGTKHVVQKRESVSEFRNCKKMTFFLPWLQRGRSTLSSKHKSKEGSLEDKEERIRHLEEVNMALKQTNDDLNEEVADLKRQLAELQTRVYNYVIVKTD